MMQFNHLYKEIEYNYNNAEQGYYNCIPFQDFKRFEHYIPGIEQATYYILTASSGVGKSKLARYLFIHNTINYVENNPKLNIKLDILYFSLEESKKKIILSEISRNIYTKYKKVISVKKLLSIGRYNILTKEELDLVKEQKEHIDKFNKYVKIYDYIRNPTGIFKEVRDHAMRIGTYHYDNDKPFTKEEKLMVMRGQGDLYKKIAYYKTYHPRHYVIVLTDHISLLQQEQGLSHHQTISKFSNDYCLHFRDRFGFTVVNVQQQAADKERVETNFRGKTIESKLEPSLDGLGDNKTTQRDANIILGLFAPERYGITKHLGYNISILKDKYRSLSILKDRDGVANKKIGLYFNGATDYFKELPKPNTPEIQKIYQKLKSN